ncbi:putative tyrosine--tRNA ligase [Helianthus annuus]|nr:putative tyrosine--tRNA ligase [Helianthus annuus]KAJ0662753.1 putative tyrosine--tRNA ligase [Helianthus annuus]
MMSAEEKFSIVRSVGEECIQEHELLKLLTNKRQPICYDGFEPSGRMHIAQGVMKTINVNKLISAGCKVKIWIADWFAFLNNKMDDDLEKIQIVGRYFIEIWKAAGMNIEGGQVEFLWASEEIISQAHEYWPIVMDIARRNKLRRIKRCCPAMGRDETHKLTAAQIFYPCMQCADIFFLKADICQLGMDQRKVNVLAREYCDKIKRKNKPIILSHHMLPGLKKGQEKMSKSDPSNAIFMEDEEDDVIQKIDNAYCPPKVVDKNPCLEYINYIVFPWFNEFKVERNAENGGEKTFTSFDELVADYEKGDVQPADLKPALSKALNRILQPVRDHFKTDENAKALFERVKVWTFSSSFYFFTNSLYLLHTVFVLFCRVLKSQNDQNRVVVLSTSTSESAIERFSSRLDELEPCHSLTTNVYTIYFLVKFRLVTYIISFFFFVFFFFLFFKPYRDT